MKSVSIGCIGIGNVGSNLANNLLKSKKNLGYSGGCNFGAKKAMGEYIIFSITIHCTQKTG